MCWFNHPNKVFCHSIILVLLIRLMLHIPIVIRATLAFFNDLTMQHTPEFRGRHV